MFSSRLVFADTSACGRERALERLHKALDEVDAVVVGAGAGLSTSAGFTYAGERFERHFHPWRLCYGFTDMYAGGFHPYSSLEEFWGFWCRNILVNRYMDAPRPVYDILFDLLEGKDYFVLTTNVDHCFQKAGVDRHRLFYTQGDYGLFQCSRPCHKKTYDNEAQVREMCAALDAHIAEQLKVGIPENELDLVIPSSLVSRCPVCGAPMTTNLRCDETFVEDEGWHAAAARYREFLRRHEGMRVLYLELGVGGNTPGIIKYPFWQMTSANPLTTYACVNHGEACCPGSLERQAILVDGDIGDALSVLV